jgi:hypothetical protein
MTIFCHPLPHQVAEEMLQVVTRAICDRPGESAEQRDSRTRQTVHSVTGLTPRDGLEYMLSSLVVGHFNLILDSLHEVFAGQTESMKARTKSTIVALDRAFIGLIKELRTERRRPLAKWTEAAMPWGEASAPPVSAAEKDALVAQMALALREEAEREATDAVRMEAAPAVPENGDRSLDTVEATPGPAVSGDRRAAKTAGFQAGSPRAGHPTSSGVGEPTAEEQLAIFERTLVAMTATLEDARAPEHANGKARAASRG